MIEDKITAEEFIFNIGNRDLPLEDFEITICAKWLLKQDPNLRQTELTWTSQWAMETMKEYITYDGDEYDTIH